MSKTNSNRPEGYSTAEWVTMMQSTVELYRSFARDQAAGVPVLSFYTVPDDIPAALARAEQVYNAAVAEHLAQHPGDRVPKLAK